MTGETEAAPASATLGIRLERSASTGACLRQTQESAEGTHCFPKSWSGGRCLTAQQTRGSIYEALKLRVRRFRKETLDDRIQESVCVDGGGWPPRMDRPVGRPFAHRRPGPGQRPELRRQA